MHTDELNSDSTAAKFLRTRGEGGYTDATPFRTPPPVLTISPGPMLSRKYEQILREEVNAAAKQHEQARNEFWRLATAFPSERMGKSVTDAAQAELAARKALARAKERLNRFLWYGEIPEDLTARV